ncbi:MAG: ATP-binding protein [Lachnospiraceae bacterium]|jgi:signal transduction histidine kinase/ActR/RegA family two-component response regulator|nr:ATP-binding protein [Lachnospiraceae bacterium]MCI1726229.1 ATP-binding protein [Lachnospiraceae bacterium]
MMTQTAFDRINIVIPLIGICILIPLILAARLEARRNYSRKNYMGMLGLNALIVITEALQIVFGNRTSPSSVFAYRLVYVLFYICIVCLCGCWMFYAYYWLNGRPVKGNMALCLTAVPLAEVLLLLINLFTGWIYYIDDSGTYVRGDVFTPFILFCYLFMIAAIAVTSVTAIRNSDTKKMYDFRLFLLFLIFPVLGPVVQYLLPDLSVMGISEAIALLTVFVGVQQKANAAYAMEKARFVEENRRYEKAMEDMLSAGPEALSIFHLNLTQNTRSYEYTASAYLKSLVKGKTVDDLFNGIAESLTEEEERDSFKKVFSRKKLLQEFELKNTRITTEYHRLTDGEETHRIRVTASMLKNPASGDIEAIFYSDDTDRQEKEEKVISAITDREYEYIALIDTATEKIHYQYISAHAVMPVTLKMENYNTVIKSILGDFAGSRAAEESFEKISYAKVSEALKTQDEYSVVIPYPSKEGRLLQKRITFLYLDERKKDILFFRTDITEELKQERERAERLSVALKEARHANQMKTEFLSNVSHDMRTPMNAVLGYTGLARKSKDPSAVNGYLEKIDKAGKILLSLINDTLELSKIESGNTTLKCAPVSCGEIISKVVGSIRPSMEEKHIHFILDNSRAVMATINVDAMRLQDIFINLLSNAVKFTPKYGEITMMVECVKLEKDLVHDRIIIQDNGCGMSPEFIPKAFEPFSQERQAATADVGGSGLGLSIVKKLVEMMGGTITVESELGKGTRFTVLLDFERADDRLPEKKESLQEWEKLKGRRVLLVEDNAMNTEIAKAILEMRGISVTCAENGETGCLRFAESDSGTYDAILMDIRMPVMNGHDAARKIREMNRPDAKTVPIIAMSADAFAEDIEKSLDAGMNEHIAKPVDPATLCDVLLKYIR